MSEEKKIRLLIVDDQQSDLKISKRAFTRIDRPVSVEVMSKPEEVEAYLNQITADEGDSGAAIPDLILMDIKMPRMDGIELLSNLKMNEAVKGIPVIMLTSSKNQQDVRECYRRGASGYIQKPVDYDELVEQVKIFVEYWWDVMKLPRDVQ